METDKTAINFHLNSQSGVAPYLQLVHQVKQALYLGYLKIGDQLPTMREVVSKLAINPNTVFKAYRTLEFEGLVKSRPGIGTFVLRTLVDLPEEYQEKFQQSLTQWLHEAYAAGLEEESIRALFESTLQHTKKNDKEEIA